MINRNLSKINSKLCRQKTKIEDRAKNGISNVQSVAYRENTRQDKQIVNICPHFANDKKKIDCKNEGTTQDTCKAQLAAIHVDAAEQ